jgi:hypothetical protein
VALVAGIVPYADVARVLDAIAATRSRLAKDAALVDAFRAMLARGARSGEVAAACYLLAPEVCVHAEAEEQPIRRAGRPHETACGRYV